jgi:hypothetical protein
MRVRDLNVKLGLDWGGSGPSSSPGCVLWGAALPDNRAHIFDELKMMRLSIQEAAEQIRERTLGDWKMPGMPTIYCDPALKIKTGQIGEDYIQTFARYRVILTPVSNAREAGWQRVHEALRAGPNGQPWLTVHPRCKYLIRTIPAMVQDDHNLEDLDTDSDDHACDALRYMLMGGLRALGPTVAREIEYPVNSHGWWQKHYFQPQEDVSGVLA